MRIYASREAEYLFSKGDWQAVTDHQKQRMAAEIDSIEPNRLLNTSMEDLCAYFIEKYRLDVPVLQENRIDADQRETQIDVSQDFDRVILDRDRPFHIAGTTIEITVPFSGDAQMFWVRPTTSSIPTPRAVVKDDHLLLPVQGTDLDAEKVRAEIDGQIADINRHLERQRTDAAPFNEQLHDLARQHIERRREKLLADRNLVAALGFPLKERPDALKTYAALEVRRRITPTMPRASTAPYKPEPVLSMDHYEHILSVMTNMTLVMERSPSAFAAMDEEVLRWHFLVQLNGLYEGQATGETFNYEGKTDILIRVNGRNIFIAECKYWGGPKKLTETIDQLLGYTSWRDTKVLQARTRPALRDRLPLRLGAPERPEPRDDFDRRGLRRAPEARGRVRGLRGVTQSAVRASA
jgi:hypothetical protein